MNSQFSKVKNGLTIALVLHLLAFYSMPAQAKEVPVLSAPITANFSLAQTNDSDLSVHESFLRSELPNKDTVDEMNKAAREAYYLKHQINVFQQIPLNLLPFSPGLYQEEDWGWAIFTSVIDAAAIGLLTYTLATSGLSSFGNGWAVLGLIAYVAIPLVSSRTLAVLRTVDIAGRHNQALKERLRLNDNEQHGLSTPALMSYEWKF